MPSHPIEKNGYIVGKIEGINIQHPGYNVPKGSYFVFETKNVTTNVPFPAALKLAESLKKGTIPFWKFWQLGKIKSFYCERGFGYFQNKPGIVAVMFITGLEKDLLRLSNSEAKYIADWLIEAVKEYNDNSNNPT